MFCFLLKVIMSERYNRWRHDSGKTCSLLFHLLGHNCAAMKQTLFITTPQGRGGIKGFVQTASLSAPFRFIAQIPSIIFFFFSFNVASIRFQGRK